MVCAKESGCEMEAKQGAEVGSGGVLNNDQRGHPPQFLPHLWSRDGFDGSVCVRGVTSPSYQFDSFLGQHVPRLLTIEGVAAADSGHGDIQPTCVAMTGGGVALSVSKFSGVRSYLWRNVDADELHFVQSGNLTYATEFGILEACPGDFVLIPRSVTYYLMNPGGSSLRLIVESPNRLELRPPALFGMINMGRDVGRPQQHGMEQFEVPRKLVIKSIDGITSFQLVNNPLGFGAILLGEPPVWRLSLSSVQPATYVPDGGPPLSFINSVNRDLLIYPLSSRPGKRPPLHNNADYDELTYYYDGPGEYGGISAPGTFAVVPKGITHWGPDEDVKEGYMAWMLESAGTFRFTESGESSSVVMDPSSFGEWSGGEVKS